LLALDRAFTYDLPAELDAGVGSYVRFRFHGKLTKGWVLGPTSDLPARTLPVIGAVSPVRFFDAELLDLARWISTRYVTPLAEVLGALSPPRVASEEPRAPATLDRPVATEAHRAPTSVWGGYTHGPRLDRAIASGEGAFVVRPAPEDEQRVAVEAVRACLAGGRRAIVLVPEASPLPATVAALEEAFGDRLVVFAGGDARARYRTWLRINAGEADVVVGTRPAVFAPLPALGMVWVARESHPAHREERAPYHHVRDVALRRAAIGGGVAVLAAACPSTETAALGLPTVVPSTRRWPKVEVVRPGPEGRAPRLVRALGDVRRAFLYSPLPGAGVAQVCRTCGAPAACAACGGTLRASEGEIRCVVCEAQGRCAVCGGTTFGVRRGGAERVEAWATRTARVPVTRITEPRLPAAGGEVLVGGADAVRDLGVASLDLVAILDADLAARRPGLTARERALAIWMEAVGWARPAGSAIVQTAHPGDPAVQALVRGSPDRFHERERERRQAAGFPVGAAVFRVIGTEALEGALAEHRPITSLVTSLGGRTVCLLALEPDRVPAFGDAMRRLAAAGVVERVEAEPHL
jgi:primosomal protein N' (replication factor Y)